MRSTTWHHCPAHDLLWQGAPTCWMPDCTTPSVPHHGPDVRDQRSAYDALSNGGGARLPWRLTTDPQHRGRLPRDGAYLEMRWA